MDSTANWCDSTPAQVLISGSSILGVRLTKMTVASRSLRPRTVATATQMLVDPWFESRRSDEAATARSVFDATIEKGQRLGFACGPDARPRASDVIAPVDSLDRGRVLANRNGPLPRLACITDGGNHQTQYFRRVLKRMRHPRRPDQRLKWEWVIDCYHACACIWHAVEKHCCPTHKSRSRLGFQQDVPKHG